MGQVINLEDMLNIYKNYTTIFEKYNFKKLDSGGKKAWSIRWVKNETYIDLRYSKWSLYNKDENEEMSGFNSTSLDAYLSKRIGG